jgi:hypothetical protein
MTVSESFPAHSPTSSFDLEPTLRDRSAYASLRLLIVGDPVGLASVLPVIDRHFPGPVHLYDRETIPLLPSFTRGTVVLTGVNGYGAADQNRLFDWLTEYGAAHPFIVATSGTALWPLVERGTFRADLFYRLNVVSIPAQVAACMEALALSAAAGAALVPGRRYPE